MDGAHTAAPPEQPALEKGMQTLVPPSAKRRLCVSLGDGKQIKGWVGAGEKVSELAQRLQIFLGKDFSRMNRSHFVG